MVRPGVAGYLKTLATELAPEGITVNSIAPGPFATARTAQLGLGKRAGRKVAPTPAGRLGSPRELGDLAAFLCSTRASFVTGTTMRIDGGLSHAM